jgi:hypothetical protein
MFGPSSLSELLFICEINQLLERDRSMDSVDLVATVSRMTATYIKGANGVRKLLKLISSSIHPILSVFFLCNSFSSQ